MAGIGRRCTLPLIMQDGLIAEQRGRQDRGGLGQQVASHAGQQSELPESGRKAQHCRGFPSSETPRARPRRCRSRLSLRVVDNPGDHSRRMPINGQLRRPPKRRGPLSLAPAAGRLMTRMPPANVPQASGGQSNGPTPTFVVGCAGGETC